MARKQKGKRHSGASWKTQAQLADKYELYEKSVQQPDADVALVTRIYRNRYERPPRSLREDFCGTAVFAYMIWDCVRRRSTQSATGILYLTMVFVFIGELTAQYLLRWKGLAV